MKRNALLAEFIGTFALVFIGVGVIAGGSGIVAVALAHGLVVAVMASATAHISGGHINPAVTIGLFFAKKIDSLNAIGYVIAQCLGAIAASIVIGFCYPANAAQGVVYGGTPALGEGISIPMALITEAVLTFFLVFAVYGTAVDHRAAKMGGLFIGLTVAFDILMGGAITGAAMNPARHLGPALISGRLEHIWLYWAGPVLGGVLAALCYQKFLEE